MTRRQKVAVVLSLAALFYVDFVPSGSMTPRLTTVLGGMLLACIVAICTEEAE